MDTIAERLRQARKEAGLSQEALAKAARLKYQSVIGNIESGASKNSQHVPVIAHVLGVEPLWLSEGMGPKQRRKPELVDLEFHPDIAPVKRVLITVQAGISGYAIEMCEEKGLPIFFRRDWLQARGLRSDQLVAVRVKGRSMEPGLWDGDLVVINLADKAPVEGEVFSVNFEGEPVIKRMKRRTGGWWLTSDNDDQKRYEPKLCTEDVEIIGRVVYKQSEVI
jgi:phage repressor protein C with HTH and peptisase S24 domain